MKYTKYKQILNVIGIVVMAYLLINMILPHAAFASGDGSSLTQSAPTPAPVLCNPLKVNSVIDLIYLVVDIVTYIGGIIAVLAILFSGCKFVMALGNPKKIEEARNYLFAVVIGTAILLGAQGIVIILKNTLSSAGILKSNVFGQPSSLTTSGTSGAGNSSCSTKKLN